MNALRIPPPYCPFSYAINPFVEQAQQHSLDWVCEMGIAAPGSKPHKRYRAAKMAWLSALVHPTFSLDDLNLAADWHTWLFSHDDVCDAPPIGRDPIRMAAFHDDLFSVLDGNRVGAHALPLTHALHDILHRIHQRTSAQWVERFAHDVRQYFQGNRWEATNRARGIQPDLATYSKMRLMTGSVYTCYDLIGISEDIDPCADFLQHAYIQQLATMANHHICWINDIFGLEKELREGNIHNLVLVLQHEHQIDLQTAVERAIQMCDAEMRGFIGLESHLSALDPIQRDEAAPYVAGVRAWIRGHIDWYTETGRYTPEVSTQTQPQAR